MVDGDPAATVATRLMIVSPAPRVSVTSAGIARLGRRTHGQRRQVLVELQRAHRCGVAELQIVPRPSGPDALIVEELVVADDAAVDLVDARGPERRGPFVEHGRRPSLARVDRRIAAAAHEEIAFEHAAFDRRGRFERGGEPVIPAEDVRRRRERDDLHVGRRHHQPAGVEVEERARRCRASGCRRPTRRAP